MLQYIFPVKDNSAWKCLVIIGIGLVVLMLSITGCASNGDVHSNEDVDSNGDYERLEKHVAELQSQIDELRRTTSETIEVLQANNRSIKALVEGTFVNGLDILGSHIDDCHFNTRRLACAEFRANLEEYKASFFIE